MIRGAIYFTALQVAFGFVALLPAKLLPHGLWISVPLLFASAFVSFTIAMAITERRLASIDDLRGAIKDGSDMFLSWATYITAGTVITGLIALYAKIV